MHKKEYTEKNDFVFKFYSEIEGKSLKWRNSFIKNKRDNNVRYCAQSSYNSVFYNSLLVLGLK